MCEGIIAAAQSSADAKEDEVSFSVLLNPDKIIFSSDAIMIAIERPCASQILGRMEKMNLRRRGARSNVILLPEKEQEWRFAGSAKWVKLPK